MRVRMRKKIVAVMMCMILGLSVISCGKKEDGNGDEELTPTPTSIETGTPTPIPEPTSTPETTPTPVPGEQDQTTEDQTTGDQTTPIIDGTKYHNETYGFEITVPDDYVIYDEETSMNIIYQSMAALYQSVDEMIAAFDSVGIKYPFVSVTSKPIEQNASANIIVQLCPSSVLPGTLEDIIKQSLDSSSQQYISIGVTPTMGEPKLVSVDGKDICVADSSVYIDGDFAGTTYKDFTLYQKYLGFDSGSNRIIMNCTYYNEEEGKAIDEMINSIHILK